MFLFANSAALAKRAVNQIFVLKYTGGKMLLTNITIKGFGPYQDEETICFGSERTVGIYGPNGSGKTFLLEAAFACLYEEFPSRTGPIYTHLNSASEGKISLEFELNGRSYRAVRDVRVTKSKKSQSACLFEDGVLIAGPKTSDFKDKVQSFLGPPRSALASIFSAQTKAGDIIDLSPSERKELLADWLHLDECEILSQEASNQAKSLRPLLDEVDANIKILDKEEARLPECVAALKSKEETLGKHNQDLEGLNNQLQGFFREKVVLEAAVRKAEELSTQVTTAKSRLEEIKNQRTRTQERLRATEAMIARKAEIETKSARYSEVKNELAVKRDGLQKLRKDHDDYRQKKSELEKQFHAANEHMAVLKTRSETCGAQAAIISEVHCSRRDCRFLLEAWKAREVLPELTKRIAKGEQYLAGLSARIKELPTPAPVEPLCARIKELENEARQLEPFLKLAGQLATAQSEHDYLTREVAGIERKEKEKASEIESITLQIRNSATTLERAKLVESQILLVQNQVNELQNTILGLSQEIGQVKAEVAGMLKVQQTITAQKDRRRELAEEIQEYELIALIFGKNGVQPLVIDGAMPELETLTRQVLSSATSKKFDVSFETQRQTQKQTLKETLDIIVTDLTTGQRRDISNFSGGEKTLLREVIRMAMSIFQAEKSNLKWDTFFLDESLAELDEINAQKFLSTIASLTRWFSRILFISHNKDLTLQANRQIKVVEGRIEDGGLAA